MYESSFSGYSTYYFLTESGIGYMVVHAADVLTTQYEVVKRTEMDS